MSFEMTSLRMVLDNDIKKAQTEITQILTDTIRNQKTLDNLKLLINTTFPDKCRTACRVMQDMSVKYGNQQILMFERFMSMFRKSFHKEFKNLKIFQMEISSKGISVPTPLIITSDSLISVKTMVSEQVAKENWSFWEGAATGAVIGSMIAPGVGTVIGGILGFFAGGCAAPDKEKVKEDTIKKISPIIKNFLSGLKNDIFDRFDRNAIALNREIERHLTAYLEKYFEEVQSRIKQQQATYSSVKEKLNRIESDLIDIEHHRQRLNSLRNAMN